MRKDRDSERGVALALAIVAALLVSIMAAIVLNLTYRSFYLSVFQSDHSVAFYASEAGVQYSFARLDIDTTFADPDFPGPPTVQPGFANAVQYSNTLRNPPGPYVVSCDASVNPDLLDPNLHNADGTRHVTVEIFFNAAWDPDYRIESASTYGNLPT